MNRLISKKATLFYTICFVCLSSFAQKYEFELFMMGSKIGELTSERKVKDGLEIYTIKSSASAKILWKEVASQSLNRIIFKDGVLTESYYEYKENGVIDKFCKTSPSGNGYRVHHWKKGKFTFPQTVTTAIAILYFGEPQANQQVYDDNWGEMVTLKKTGEHQYEYKAKDGDRNVYRYANGRIAEAEFHTSIVTVKMRPKA